MGDFVKVLPERAPPEKFRNGDLDTDSYHGGQVGLMEYGRQFLGFPWFYYESHAVCPVCFVISSDPFCPRGSLSEVGTSPITWQ